MDIWHSLMGIVSVELTSAAPEEVLKAASEAGIELGKIQTVDLLTISCWVPQKAVPRLKRLCEQQGGSLKIRKKRGLVYTARQLWRRPLLVLGGTALAALALWLPSRVLFVQVEGNQRIPANQILESAEGCGISFGASRREVRSEQVKNALLEAMPELRWVGVNTVGCTATISVRERQDLEEPAPPGGVASIAAVRDGYVLSCTVTRGNGLVRPGQSVKAGQILISAYTDCGLSIRAQWAEGEILAQTSRSLKAVTPSQFVKKGECGDSKWKISLRIRKKRINLWKDSGIWEGSCGRMYEEYYITLPGGFRLPVALCLERYDSCETSLEELPEAEAASELNAFAERYLSGQMIAGGILRSSQRMTCKQGRWCLNGVYVCQEMIGKVQQEQIGDTNGKNN